MRRRITKEQFISFIKDFNKFKKSLDKVTSYFEDGISLEMKTSDGDFRYLEASTKKNN